MLRRRLMSKGDNILWLYKEGDECIDVTGGWSVSGNVSKMENCMGWLTQNSGRQGKAVMTNAVSFYDERGRLKAKYLYVDCEFFILTGNLTTFSMATSRNLAIPFGLDKKIKPVNADDVIISVSQRITLKYPLQELSAYPIMLDLKQVYFDYNVLNKLLYNLYLGD